MNLWRADEYSQASDENWLGKFEFQGIKKELPHSVSRNPIRNQSRLSITVPVKSSLPSNDVKSPSCDL